MKRSYGSVRERNALARTPRWVVLGATLVGLLVPAANAASAQAASPWWHLTSGSRPSNLQSGAAQDEVRQLAVSATEGSYAIICELCPEDGHQFLAFVPFDASPAEVQEKFEALYGAGNVEVPKGQGNAAGDDPYEILFTGEISHRPAHRLQVFAASLAGGRAEAAYTLKSEGHPDGEVILTAANLGDADFDGQADPISIADTLPPSLTPVSIEGGVAANGGSISLEGGVECSLGTLICTFGKALHPYAQIEIRIGVEVEPGASAETNQLSATGGGVPGREISRPSRIGPSTPFGIEDYEMTPEEEGGAPTTQAGSHPFQLTTTITLNQRATVQSSGYHPRPAALVKGAGAELPAGLIGNPSPFPRCTLAKFLPIPLGTLDSSECPSNSVIGVALTTFDEPGFVGVITTPTPIYNLEPAAGEPARFGFKLPVTPVVIDSAVRSDGDYGITASSFNISQTAALVSSKLVFWGVPGDPRHDPYRDNSCLLESIGAADPAQPCRPLEQTNPPAFMTMPTGCSGDPLQTSVDAESWLNPGQSANFGPSSPMPTLDGCNRLPFSPTIAAEPTTNAATSPTGFNFDINVGDEGLTNAEGLAQSQIKKAVVTLPEGFTTNPSVAEGLHACPLAAYNSETVNSDPGTGCPEESKIGDVEIESPLVAQTIHGGLFVAKQGENPNDNLLTIYLVAKNPELGIIIKQALKVTPDPKTGQLTTEVDDIPQLPFSRFHLSFRQGQRSPLVSPPACGTYTVQADLYPYSNPNVPLHDESSFQITKGPEGNPCPSGNTPPFHPHLEAGTINNRAGSYSPFYVHMTRKDSEQEITHFSIKLPPGVAGKLAGVPYCPEAGIAQAKLREHEGGGAEEEANPSCPKASEVGRTLVGAGVGNVLAYAPGHVYLAGPSHGSNLSLVSITAARVGPFDLGTVEIRFALRINPETAEVFVDATGSDPIPHIVDGIPIHLRDIRTYIDRPQFTFNPTSCEKTSTASTVLGSGLNFASEADDQPVTVSSPFQAADCAALAFKPKLALSLIGGTKRGANPKFKAVLTAGLGDANIGSAQVTLPHSEFLDNAHIKTICTRVVFAQGSVPGEKCPADSVYGFAKAVTPILSEPLEGPVFLRSSSHQLPDLVAALHNNQVDIALDGHVEGVKGGIRNTFEAVPDAPVTKFTLEMQGGKKGLLENSTNLCARPHHATAHFEGHNGKVEDFKPLLAVKCGKHGKKKSHHGKHH